MFVTTVAAAAGDGQQATATAICDQTGERVTGGGHWVTTSPSTSTQALKQVNVYFDAPNIFTTAEDWSAIGIQNGALPSGVTWAITAFAVCAR